MNYFERRFCIGLMCMVRTWVSHVTSDLFQTKHLYASRRHGDEGTPSAKQTRE